MKCNQICSVTRSLKNGRPSFWPILSSNLAWSLLFAFVVVPVMGSRASAATPPRRAPDFLQSRALRIEKTPFDAALARVGSTARPVRSPISAGADGKTIREKLQIVNRWVNSNIRYTDDRALYGRADYWARSSETLGRRRGDCEDLAIVKRDMLAALGVNSSRMHLTIAYDLVRRADHALLIVETDDGPVMLDNSTSDLVEARGAHGYRPIFTFNEQGKWLHGYARA